MSAPECLKYNCKNKTNERPGTDQYHPYCTDCSNKYHEKMTAKKAAEEADKALRTTWRNTGPGSWNNTSQEDDGKTTHKNDKTGKTVRKAAGGAGGPSAAGGSAAVRRRKAARAAKASKEGRAAVTADVALEVVLTSQSYDWADECA